uniref:phospholipid-transporting ATPase ABCA1 isoform X2 n=1 Tax=Doryrhamphus excisus TaxID=161450 RepID=UPI0025AE67B5|nr:phospholipid-transporting ATPase ABCA1 isoform X2 [Doryrhamphus excisus]
MAFFRQLILLLWKNVTFRRRNKIQLIIEIIWPLLLFLILVAVRRSNLPFEQGQCHFLNKALPSAGTLPWMQGIICNINNPCYSSPTPGETPGHVGNHDNSIISRAFVDAQTLLSRTANQDLPDLQQLMDSIERLAGMPGILPKDRRIADYLKANETFSAYLRDTAKMSPETVDQLLKARINFQYFLARPQVQFKDLACNLNSLRELLTVDEGETALVDLQSQLCNLPADILNDAQRLFLSQVDARPLFTMDKVIPANVTDRLEIMQSVKSVSQQLNVIMASFPSLSSFMDMSKEFRLVFSKDRTVLHQQRFQAFSNIMCRRSDNGEPIPSINWYEDLGGKAILEKTSTEDKNLHRGHHNNTPFCQKFIRELESSPLTRIAWRAMKPLLAGKLLYAPNTPAVEQVMKEVNQTFQDLEIFQDLAKAWSELGPKIKNFMMTRKEVAQLKRLLKNPDVAELVDLQLQNSSWTASQIGYFLSSPSPHAPPPKPGEPSTWLDTYNDLNLTITSLAQVSQCFSTNKMEGLSSEDQLISRALELVENRQFWAGVVFLLPDSSSPELPPHVTYKIRMDSEDVTRTHKIRDRFWHPTAAADPFKYMRYVVSGFVYVQDLVDRALTRILTGAPQKTGIYVQQMPYPCHVDDGFLRVLNRSLPLFMTLAWIYSVAMIIKGVVYEKEARLKETMKIMGVNSGTLWLSWFISSLVPFLLSAALLIAVVKLGDILPYSNPIVVFFFLSAFATATIMQCFLISTFFSKANMAAACGGLIYFSLYLPYILCVAWQDQLNTYHKIFASFLSPVAFGLGCGYFSQYEEQGIGIQWHNLQSSPVQGESYNLSTVIVMLWVDAFIYAVAALYIEAVFPGDYGIPQPWHFAFHINYWIGIPLEAGMPIPCAPPEQDEDHIEPEPSNLVLGVNISNLVKLYKKGAKLAVNHLNLKFYEGQITSFLGHNGAGKTTTISVLTGLFPPTSGTVFINGKDIRYDMDVIRRTLGVCPQHNVLFDTLTVDEHMWFYGCLKGLTEDQVKAEVDSLLDDVGLLHKRHEQTKTLSGGMKRKLSVAIAFIGGSKVVVLDEPTAGVDPYARRGIWDLLLKYRKDRTIILSTHYMDEAELLGDRIAIISNGKLCCCGSPLFLKSKLGSGYYLTVVKKDPLNPSTPTTTSIDADKPAPAKDCGLLVCGDIRLASDDKTSYVAALLSMAQHHIPGAKLVEESGREAVINLPREAAKNSSMAVFLSELDGKLAELGISSYGLSDSTLEEIFLRVAAETDVDAEPEMDVNPSQLLHPSKQRQQSEPLEMDMLSGDGRGRLPLTGWRLTWQQLRALFIKRCLYARRSRRGLFAQIVLPAVFVLAALTASVLIPLQGEYVALKLQPWMYGEQYTFFSNDAPGNQTMNNLLDALLDEPGFGTKCMKMENNSVSPQCDIQPGRMFMRPQVSYSTLEMFNKGNWTKERPSPDCQCSTQSQRRMLPDCPDGAGGLPPPQIKRQTGDILQNLTSYNITDYLLKAYPQILHMRIESKKSVNEYRFGGFSLGGNTIQSSSESSVQNSIQALKTRYSVPQDSALDQFLNKLPGVMERLNTENNVKVWFNNKGWHVMVSFVNVMSNGLLRAGLPRGPQRQRHGITVYNHPLNLTKEQLSQVAMKTTAVDLVISICVIFAMSLVPASFILFLIEERARKAKHLQFVSGVKPILYWVTNFSWDMLNYTVPAVMVVLIFLCFQQQAYVSNNNLPALILLLLFYGWSITPLMYPASFIFSIPSTAYVFLTCINLFIGINGSIATFVLELFEDEYLREVNKVLKKMFLIFPHFCLGRGLIDMAKSQAIADALQRLGTMHTPDPLQWDIVGKNLFAMAADGLFFFIFTVLLQYKFFMCCRPWWLVSEVPPLGPEDEDVAKERQRVKSGKADTDILTIMDLSKVYKAGRKPAVNRLCLGIPRGECFGLLGVNGAGKTSTFSMLTGDTPITSGEAFLNHHSVLTEMEKVHQMMGYCPQFDAICDLLTGMEHLELYARLRGVPEESVTKVAGWGVKTLGLSEYAEQEAWRYSGGNKRKLSTAISLIGAPPVIFLDEPTTGMDPKAKRFLWNCVLSVTKEGRAVVLTSHSMEECEALCTRMAIMVNGSFRCLGSVQHLKNRFGDGYTIILHLTDRTSNPDSSHIHDYITRTFPAVELKEQHHNVLQYQLPSHACCLARLFDGLANRYKELGISDFSVSQTTLDQVFVNFAKEQTDDYQLMDGIISDEEVETNLASPHTQINPPSTHSSPLIPLQQRQFKVQAEKKGRKTGKRRRRSSGRNDENGGTQGAVSVSNPRRKDPSALFIVGPSTEDTAL